MAETQKIPGFCTLCKSTCGALFEVDEGRLVRALPNPAHPTGKALCIKGKAAPEILYSKDRLSTPLRRSNPKSDPLPVWEPVSWEEAFSQIGQRLRALRANHGMETVAFMTGTPSATGIADSRDWIARLMNKSGACNWLAVTELCNWQKDEGKKITTGEGIGYPDYENTDLIVFWGFNPSAVWLDQATQAAEARARGAKVLVIDPRRVGFANDANLWLRVRPGTDGLLALGIAKVLFETEGYDSEFLRYWTNAAYLIRDDNGEYFRPSDLETGADPTSFCVASKDGSLLPYRANHIEDDSLLATAQLDVSISVKTCSGRVHCRTAFAHLREALDRHSMDDIESLTGVPQDQIVTAASIISNAQSVSYYTWTGLEQQSDASQINRMLTILMSLTGSFDAKGGNLILPSVPTHSLDSPESLNETQRQKSVGKCAHPLGPAYNGMLSSIEFTRSVLDSEPYPIRALIGFGGNPVSTRPDSLRFARALQSLEFYVHCDIFPSPSSNYADYLLPVNTPWEREALRVGFASGHRANEHIQLRPRAVKPVNQSRSDIEIVMALATELGLGSDFFDGDIDAGHNYVLEPTGITVYDLRNSPGGIRYKLKLEYRKFEQSDGAYYRGMKTYSGKVELYSSVLRKNDLPPVPQFDTERLKPDTEFPFALTSAKTVYFCHSQHRHVASLRRREPEPTVSIAPKAAQQLELESGDWVTVRTAHGQIRMMLKTDPSLDPQTAVAAFGWWQGNRTLGLPGFDVLSKDGANYNLMVSEEDRDVISGAASIRSQRCQILPAALAEYSWKGFAKFHVTKLEKLTEDVTQVTLRASDGRLLPDFRPGQHLVVRARVSDQQGGELTRCYSLVSPAAQIDRKVYQIAVRQVAAPPDRPELPAGAMSNWINSQLKVGDELEIKVPSGDFILSSEAGRPLVMIAGGIGITPFMSFLETISDHPAPPLIHLHYANRTPQSEAFSSRLDELAKRISGFKLVRYYSDPAHHASTGASSSYVSAAMALNHEFGEVPAVYFCGPAPMRDAIMKDLQVLGHPQDLIFEELFGTAAINEADLPNGPFEVLFARSGKTAMWTKGDGVLLEFAEKNKVVIGSGCRAGQCESCAVRLIEGDAMYPAINRALEPSECLSCQAIPTSDIVVDA